MSVLAPRAHVISALGVVEIFAWGSTYYLLAVLTEPIVADTGWSRSVVAGGMSIGLVVAGAVATRVGRLIGQHGGRPVLATAAASIAAGLVVLATAPGIAVYLLGWVVIGLGMGAGLYDAAFATLGRLYGIGARGAITALTLWGGFASTVCWPLSALGVETIGWRGTCLAYAALHLVVTLPLCLFVLPREAPAPPRIRRPGADANPPLRNPRFWILALAGTTVAAMASLWSVHLIAIMQSLGLTFAAAVALGTLIGPAQVGARVMEMVTGARYHPVWTMLSSALLIGGGLLGLALGLPAAIAIVGYGAGNGLWSIARGAVPLAVFGADDYPMVIGALATPALLASAVSPYLGAVLVERVGGGATLVVLCCAAAVPLACALVLVVDRRRTPSA